MKINHCGDFIEVEYSDLSCALRAIGAVLSSDINELKHIEEKPYFTTIGVMLDCSRNAVMKADYFKGWLQKLALLGYNMAMLYTEDTFALDGEPYFGYHRGPYSRQELEELSAYASKLGIEMVGCIQTLGHMKQVLKLPMYKNIMDTPEVLLACQDETYALIEKMVRLFAKVYTTHRIHIGMDEAHDLGRGRYMDLFGYKRNFEIFNEHLHKVVQICRKYNLEPMIWSDMYFRMGSKTGDYYDPQSIIPDEVKNSIPKEIQLVYWDYYHRDEKFYLDWITRHRDLGFEPIMASGIWTWPVLWYGSKITEIQAGACINACKKAQLKEIFFTMWGDDGAYCDYDSAMAGLTYSAELCHTDSLSKDSLQKQLKAICQSNYEAITLAGNLDMYGHPDDPNWPCLWAASILWDDPLMAKYWIDEKLKNPEIWPTASEHYRKLAQQLSKYKVESENAGDLKHAILLAKLLAAKIDIRLKLEEAYNNKNKQLLAELTAQIPQMIDFLNELDQSFRKQWLKRNRSFGLEVLQIRMAGLIRRYRELRDRTEELLNGRIDRIDEMEDLPKSSIGNDYYLGRYDRIATSSEKI